MSKFTYAIGWRHSPDREANLRRVLSWLSHFPDLDVLVVEQDDSSKFSPPAGVRHVFAKSSAPFNRSWGFNIAFKESDSPNMIFGDSDILMQVHEFRLALDAAESLDVLSPYSSVLDLLPFESQFSIEDMGKIARPGRGEADHQKINLCGGVVFFSRFAFEKIGGWDEDFEGWGGEDDMMSYKVAMASLRAASMPFRCYHLWHTRGVIDQALYSRTISMLRTKVSLGGSQVLDLALQKFTKCGDKDKFS